MPKIYLINVGANTAHHREARSPIFEDDTFVYVSFPEDKEGQLYPAAMRPFLSSMCSDRTHLDPDWENATYGDNCKNPRAGALMCAGENDILLFWALLQRNAGKNWSTWTGDRGWYLIGAIRIDEVLEPGDSIAQAKERNQLRASHNAHIIDARVRKVPGRFDRVFIGLVKHSRRFERAIDLEIGKDNSLFQRAIRTADGRMVNWNGPPRWNSVTRSCRAVWNLDAGRERDRANLIRDQIQENNPDFDLLVGL